MKKIILFIMLSGYVFGHTLTDTTSTKISAQDSIGTYVPTMLFAVQNKVGGAYKWKKMYMWQLMGIMHDSVGAIIPRLTGTPTTHISLKTFSDNTLYRSDFNYNFRKLDSLTTVFSLNDFKFSGDTLKLKNAGGVDTTRIGFLSKGNIWTGSNVYSLGYIKLKNPATSYDITLTSLATANRTIYLPDVSSDTLAGRSWVRGTTTALPSQSGRTGKFLQTNGATASWQTGAGGGVDTSKSYTWTGTNTFNNQVTINSFGGGLTCIPVLALGFPSTTYGNINFYNSVNSNYVSLYPPAAVANRTIYFPDASGTIALTSTCGILANANHWTNNNLFENNY